MLNMENTENEERILTLNYTGKSGVNILKSKYDIIKEITLTTLRENGPTHKMLRIVESVL